MRFAEIGQQLRTQGAVLGIGLKRFGAQHRVGLAHGVPHGPEARAPA